MAQVDSVDLRSPVRVNEQYTLYDGTLDSGQDLDGDGKTDSVDVAIYTKVIGCLCTRCDLVGVFAHWKCEAGDADEFLRRT